MPHGPKVPKAPKVSKARQKAADASQAQPPSEGFGFTSVEVSGLVVKKPFAAGSKSAHPATFLETSTGSYVLRRRDGNPFYDAELEKLVAKNIRCTGILTGNTLIISDWTVL